MKLTPILFFLFLPSSNLFLSTQKMSFITLVKFKPCVVVVVVIDVVVVVVLKALTCSVADAAEFCP